MAYDDLKHHNPLRANKEYVTVLYMASQEGQDRTESVIRHLLSQDLAVSSESVRQILAKNSRIPSMTDVAIDNIALEAYDELLDVREEVACHG